jgi:hypothetical protein
MSRKIRFEGSLALKQPKQRPNDIERITPQIDEQAFPQGIARHQATVEIDYYS